MLKNLTKIIVDDHEYINFVFDKLLDDLTIENEHPNTFSLSVYRDYRNELFAPQVAYNLANILSQDTFFSRPLNNVYLILDKKDIRQIENLFWIVRLKNGSQIICSPNIEFFYLIKNDIEAIYKYDFPKDNTRYTTSLQKKALLTATLLESRDIELNLEQIHFPLFEPEQNKIYFVEHTYFQTKDVIIYSSNIPFHSIQSYQTLNIQISDTTLLKLTKIDGAYAIDSLEFGDYFSPSQTFHPNQEAITQIIRVISEKKRHSISRNAIGEPIEIIAKS